MELNYQILPFSYNKDDDMNTIIRIIKPKGIKTKEAQIYDLHKSWSCMAHIVSKLVKGNA